MRDFIGTQRNGLRWTICLLAGAILPFTASAAPVSEKGPLTFQSLPDAMFRFGGVLGQRIDVNVDHWLLRAPQANPGMLEMFRQRDRKPVPNLVPWAGEFVGKYLISAIQSQRLSTNSALERQVRDVIAELIATQAEDGYLGPFPQAVRLTANWDLWGHYHCIEALLMWHERNGDDTALTACRRAADLACRIFLDTSKRPLDAGSDEMNLAFITALGHLHRLTGEARYLRLMREIEKDWERAGDYFRTGLVGVEYFQTPRPRWESLHDLQGLVELYRITGDARYRQSFEHHWRSIARWDRHNTGGFSTGEQATGNPYGPGAIETCCTIAWMALGTDMLRLTGDPRVADELELSTFNGAAGAQHPSGRWWTYNTPMDGVREASAHTIVFQSRAGTPELNCCSVNAPRSLGMLSEWAVMRDANGLVVNHYGPGQFRGRLADQTQVTLEFDTEYPLDGKVRLRVVLGEPRDFTLKLRIPSWSSSTTCRVNAGEVNNPRAGRYLELKRRWSSGDLVELAFDTRLRFVPGDREMAGKVSLYAGPLLLAYDQRFNAFDEDALPSLDLGRLAQAKRVTSPGDAASARTAPAPWLLLDLPTSGGRTLRLCDYAAAGANGTRYRSWLTAERCPPPSVVTRQPAEGGEIPTTGAVFKWTGPRKMGGMVAEYRLTVAATDDFATHVLEIRGLKSNRAVITPAQIRPLNPGQTYFWKVTAVNAHGTTDSVVPAARFSVDLSLPAQPLTALEPKEGPNGLLISAPLHGDPKPEFGEATGVAGFKPVPGPNGEPASAVELDGKTQMLRYVIEEFPEEDYSVTVRVRIHELPANRLGQIFSAWCVSMDDPLRLAIQGGKLFARIEAGQGYGTPGTPVEAGRWYHLAAVKSGSQLTLFLDGKPAGSTPVPHFIRSSSREIALGGNPRYSGNEFLAAQFSDFKFFARALSAQEVADLSKSK